MSRYILGIDQGTTLTTALVLDEAGRRVAVNSAPVPVQFPEPGRVEQPPEAIVRSVIEAATPLVERYPISAVGLDNQGETFLLWDRASGEPLTPAVVWQDKRGLDQCQSLEQAGYLPMVRQKTGLRLDPYFSASKLSWFLERDITLRERAAAGEVCFGTTDTWVLWNLAGRVHITDPSTAARTLLYNIHDLRWDEELLRLFDIPVAILPDVVGSTGELAELRLPGAPPIPVTSMLCDQPAALFGQGCLNAGQAKCSLGTGAFVLMNIGQRAAESAHSLLSTVAWRVGDRTDYALDGGIFVAGAAVQWLRDGLGIVERVEDSAELALAAKPDATVFVPSLAGLAAPHWLPEAGGVFLGLSRGTGRAELCRAVLDGVALRIVDVVRAMEADSGQSLPSLRVDGGPSTNRYLMQRLADLLGIPVAVASEPESTALGVGWLAEHAAFGTPLDTIAARWSSGALYEPRMVATERDVVLERWERALGALRYYHGVEESYS